MPQNFWTILFQPVNNSFEVIDMKKDKGIPYVANATSQPFFGQPDDCFELINRYGTYNIQPTADTRNPFPSIAQGLPRSLNTVELDKDDIFPEDTSG